MMTILIVVSTVLVVGGVAYAIYHSKQREITPLSIASAPAVLPVIDTNKKEYPIEAVYSYVSRDYKEEGYNDAFAAQLADVGFKHNKIKTIKDEGILLCEKAILIYNADIGELDVRIDIAGRDMLHNSEAELKNQKELYCDHIRKIQEIISRLQNGDVCILNTYETGFTKGEQVKITSVIGKYDQ